MTTTTTICRTCGFTDCTSLATGEHCPRWSAGMFADLTRDELKSLAAAIRTEHGYSSNKMSLLLAGSPDRNMQATYAQIATEVGLLFIEVCDQIIATYGEYN